MKVAVMGGGLVSSSRDYRFSIGESDTSKKMQQKSCRDRNPKFPEFQQLEAASLSIYAQRCGYSTGTNQLFIFERNYMK